MGLIEFRLVKSLMSGATFRPRADLEARSYGVNRGSVVLWCPSVDLIISVQCTLLSSLYSLRRESLKSPTTCRSTIFGPRLLT